MGSVELNAGGSSLDKKLIKSCIHLPFLRESGKVSFPWLCSVLFGGLWYFLSQRHYVCSKCVCFETLWNAPNCVPGCGITLLLDRCSNSKISATLSPERGTPVLLEPRGPRGRVRHTHWRPAPWFSWWELGWPIAGFTWGCLKPGPVPLVSWVKDWWLYRAAECQAVFQCLMAFNQYLSVHWPIRFFAGYIRIFKLKIC